MKKISLFCAALLALAATSCEENPGLGIPQTNPQEALMEVNGFAVEYGQALAGTTMDLANYATTGEVPVITVTKAENLPAGAEVELRMQLASQADYSDAITLNVNADGCVSQEAWNEYFRSKLGKSPAEKPNFVRFSAFVKSEGQLVSITAPDQYLAAKEVAVTPIPMNFVIEEKYYILGTLNDWNLSAPIEFNHSDANVYDDPNFTMTVEISAEQAEGGWWWKIAPESAVQAGPDNGGWDMLLGTAIDGESALEGSLVDQDVKAGCIKEAGKFKLTINLMDMTYKFEKLTYMYTPGESNSWNPAGSQMLFFDANKGAFVGFAYLKGEFKFTSQPNWDGTNYGAGEEGKISTSGGNLSVAEEGLYFCKVNTEDLTYELTKVNTFGMIGGFNSWGGDEFLTPSENMLVWTGTLTLADASEWKFRANSDWAVNLGGDMLNLVPDGSNLSLGAGTYTVTLDLSRLPYSCTAVSASGLRRK